MRILVTGAGGTVGGRIAALLARGHEVIAVVREAPPPAGLQAAVADLTRPDSTERLLDAHRPEAVVHCAAFSNADACEREPAAAELLNARVPARLGRECAQRGVRLIALSTDLVLPGKRALSSESAPTAASGLVYGRTKRAGETAVLAASGANVVLRIPLMIGRGHGARGTASEAVLWALRAGQRPRLFTDQYRSPTDPESLADLIERSLARSCGGLFHAGGAERISRYALGVRVARAFGLDAEAIEEAISAEQPLPRPQDVSLDSSRALRELGWHSRALDEALLDSRLQAGAITSAARSGR